MAFDDLLVLTAKAFTRDGTTDRLGQPVEASTSGSPFWTGPCRLSNKVGGKVNTDRFDETFENYWTVFLDAGADVKEDDIVQVFDAAGDGLILTALVQRRYDIYAGTADVHHVELLVYEQTGPEAGPGQTQ